jgi:group I intron endonuclease
MKNVIYKIRNVVNQNFYVGSTVDSRKRFWEHRKDLRLGVHCCVRLQRAWNKYGEDCFKFEIVEQVATRQNLFSSEQKWLDEHFGKDHCYNVSKYAASPMRDATLEMRANLAKKTKAWHALNGHPRTGVVLSEEQKQKIKEGRIGKHAGSEHYRYGKTVSEKTKKKIGDSQRGVPKGPGRTVSPEGMAKIRAAAELGHYSHWKGRKHSKESKAKMSKPVSLFTVEGVEIRFASITHLRLGYDMTATTVNRALKSGKPFSKGPHKGVVIKYSEPLASS